MSLVPTPTMAFVQARVGSTRLPGKVLEPVSGTPTLIRIVNRLRRSILLDRTVVLTTTEPGDDVIASLCGSRGIDCIRGSDSDVLSRFAVGIRTLRPATVVRITADSPLIDATIVDQVINLFRAGNGLSYATTATAAPTFVGRQNRFPSGLDVEVVAADALLAADEEAAEPYDREHVTPFVMRQPDRFPAAILESDRDHGQERWTVDYPADLEFVRAIYERLGSMQPEFGWRDVLRLLEREPELRQLNAAYR